VPELEKLFAPKSIAVIGVSRRESSLGKMFLDAMVQLPYTGKIFPVNPKADRINNIPCYPDISSLPEVPELAVVLLSKEIVLQTVEELARKGVQAVMVISAGFKESGAAGIELEKKLLQLVQRYHLRMIGPNCMGLFNTHPGVMLNATFSPAQPIPGHVGFISQSGALGVAMLALARSVQLGFSIFVSTGNKADITDVDVLEYMREDENTRVIILYQESIDHPAAFRTVCSRIVPFKPILSLKAGRTASGNRAASSHAGALAADDILTGIFLNQCGVIRCDTLQELVDAALTFSRQPLPAGNRIAVITNSGGPAILASDAVEKSGLNLAALSRQTFDRLQQLLPAEAACNNPIDMIASAVHDTYKNVYTVVEQDPGVDAIIVIIVKPPTDTTPEKIIESITGVNPSSTKPLLVVLMADLEQQVFCSLNQKYSLPFFNYPEPAVDALSKMWKYRQIKEAYTATAPAVIPQKDQVAVPSRTVQAGFEEIAKRLQQQQLPLVPYIITTDRDRCLQFHKQEGPVAMKIANAEIIHKSDAGLVLLDLADPAAVVRAYEQLTRRAQPLLPGGVQPLLLVQKMIPAGIELVLGYKCDPVYGDVVMFGIGGVWVELYKDITFRILPASAAEIRSMIREIKGFKLLSGFRQSSPFDLDRLTELIMQFTRLVTENTDIVEMDLNPLIWPYHAAHPVIVDGRMTLRA
jgi:acetate---CoA ligase (ADP-forming)